ncbi:hypothetical protein EV645_7415 [Kribbella rubisoli]|uniref:Uncharacterized protein n=1 Tax=Kribbella rubisoli TaxID=3075929 RepID=A0A4Q7W2E2_9ACTN|nr:DUF5320 domain-containing protein [Kribbella rubisoli]RZU03387.1 hypothetical protein EV645_7415 [Kribbella rubisoli]
MTDWWRERRQNEQLEDLQSEMSYARQETSRLQSQLSKIQGGLQERVNRLSSAFDAFVELSDLRYEMAGFLEAAELRRYASRVLTAMASSTPLPPAAEPVPQYWLGPATSALIGLTGGQDEQALGVAMGLDERRTSTFLALALAALGQRHQVRTEWLDVAFGVLPADGTVTRVQRVLWATAARGGFGADGLALVAKRLQSVAPPADGWLPKLEKRGETPRSSGTRFEAVAEQVTARTRLGRVLSAVETIAGNTEAREPAPALSYTSTDNNPELTTDSGTGRDNGRRSGRDSAPDSGRGSGRDSGREYARGSRRGQGARGSGADGAVARDSTAALLRLLISEGSEPERESLARVAVLRAQISGAGESAAERLEDSVGTVEELLADDLSQNDDPHLAAAVLRVIGPSVLPAVEDLAKVAGQPSPPQIDVASDGHTIAIRPDGPDQLQLNTALSSIKQSAGVVTAAKYAVPAALVGVGAVVAIGLGFVNAIWIVAGLILIGIGAFRYWSIRTAAKADKTAAADRATRLTDRCTTAATQLADYTKTTETRQTAVTTTLTTIRNHLTT